MLRYFEAQVQYLSVGPPVYFVVRDGHDYTHMTGQNVICGRAGCDEFSLSGQVFFAAQQPYRWGDCLTLPSPCHPGVVVSLTWPVP